MIYEKLQQARVQLQKKKLKKSGKNNYSGFEYFELGDFLPTVNEIFLNLKMSSNFSMLKDCATLTLYDWEDKTETTFTTPSEELDLKGCNKVQALGGVHTYLKRYLYMNALEIVEADMFDKVSGRDKEPEKIKNSPSRGAEPPQIEQNGFPPDEAEIYANLECLTDTKSAFEYFQQNVQYVSDKTAFRKEYQKLYNKLKNAGK